MLVALGHAMLTSRALRTAGSALLLAAGAAACTGEIGSTSGQDGDGEKTGPDTQALCAKGELPGPHPRLVRLTHPQYDNTVRVLLQLPDVTPSQNFIDDPAFSGFTNNAAALLVSERLGRDYRRAAESLAELAAAPGAIDNLIPCDAASGDAACAEDFITSFGLAAYRRPLTESEVAGYVAHYERGQALYTTGSAFEQGIRHLIEGFLQSPHFLYRVELSEELDADVLIPLSGYEVASRLSYLLWNSMPDGELLDAAAAGELTTDAGIEAQARRLLDDPRATAPVDDFHEQWLDLARYDNVSKDATLYPDFGPTMPDSMKEETKQFIRHVILELSGSQKDLLTSRTTFVNDDLAPFYGLEGSFGPDFVEVELDPEQRAGLLTQIGFLASHAYTNSSSPIHRGVFVQRQILCEEIPDPPGDIDTTLPALSEDIKTTKQQVEVHTSPDACTGCHSMINAPGYALETFDAVGAWRTTDNGEPVDPTGTFPLDGDEASVDGPIDLIDQLAASPSAQECYLRQWYRYGFAREETEADECTMTFLNETFAAEEGNVKEMLVAFTLTKTFRYRIEEEIQQ